MIGRGSRRAGAHVIGRRSRGAGALVLALAVALAVLAGSAAAAPRVKTSLTAVWFNYMCVSCHEPLPVAQSPQAISEREFIQRLVVEGDTPAQIERQMVAQYSVAVLAKPPAHGFNLLIYVLPPAVLLFGLGFLGFSLPKWRARARQAGAEPYASGGELSADDTERLDAELARFD